MNYVNLSFIRSIYFTGVKYIDSARGPSHLKKDQGNNPKNRMRTDRGSSHLGGGGGADHPHTPPPPDQTHHLLPVNRMTDRCKNITVPHTSYAIGKKRRYDICF